LPAGERAAWLDVACAGQPELRAEVEALLRSHMPARTDLIVWLAYKEAKAMLFPAGAPAPE
jgi:hypothetical protein